MSLNKMMIIGNLGADPELRYTPSGKAVTNLRVAVNSNRRGPDGEWQEETLWLRVEVWDQAAERAAEQFRKGNKVYAEGAPVPASTRATMVRSAPRSSCASRASSTSSAVRATRTAAAGEARPTTTRRPR